MKFIFLPIICLSILVAFKPYRETDLYDSSGNAAAFIDDYLADRVIYLWDGSPEAYLVQTDVFGFNGKHLGWFEKGILRDNDGKVVATIKEAADKITVDGSLKGLKKMLPEKKFHDMPPIRPYFSALWSLTRLNDFLKSGTSN
ncbi:MAG: hypothetical protein JO080_03765 [Mucilaginibacter sp.]|nr:hypothetical protein [Mucilaginibacter sp.]